MSTTLEAVQWLANTGYLAQFCRDEIAPVVAAELREVAFADMNALRLSLAQAQAREAKLRAWLKAIAEDDRGGAGEVSYDEFAYKRREAELQDAARKALATPADDGALRALLTQVARAAMSCGGSRANAKLDFVADIDVETIVDNALGGAA